LGTSSPLRIEKLSPGLSSHSFGILKQVLSASLRNLTTAIILFGLLSCNSHSSKPEQLSRITELSERTTKLNADEVSHLDSLNIETQLRGNCYAYSSDKNSEASNGEAHSDNLPQKVDKSFPRDGFYLVINQNELTVIDSSILGCKLYLVNTTDSKKELKASDSRLYIVAEALNDKKEWTPITYLPLSKCGNSYHTVVLDKDEYWTFDIPIFKGNFKTKLRYTLPIGNEKKIYSNEIIAYLNEGQFNNENKQGDNATNIMDPYDE